MSIKSLIDVRYTLPGYTVLIMITGITFPYLNDFLTNIGDPSTNLIIGAVFILGTSPLGYLFSQIWYVLLYAVPISGNKNYIKSLLEKKPNLKTMYYLIVLDSILYQSKQEKLKQYVDKRWSLYNMIGSSLVCTICGLIVGILFRLYLTNWEIQPILMNEKAMILFAVIMSILFYYGIKNIRNQYDEMLTILIKEYLQLKPTCLDTFPNYYFKNSK